MSPENVGIPIPPDDGLGPADRTGASDPVPPQFRPLVSGIEEGIRSAQSEVDASVESVLAPIEKNLTAAQIDHDAAVAETLGRIDSDLRTAATPHFTAIDRVTNDTFRNLAFAQEDLRAVGVAMPTDVDAIRADLADASGANIYHRLLGVDPYAENVRAFEGGSVEDIVTPVALDPPPEVKTDVPFRIREVPPVGPAPPSEIILTPAPPADCHCAEVPPVCPPPTAVCLVPDADGDIHITSFTPPGTRTPDPTPPLPPPPVVIPPPPPIIVYPPPCPEPPKPPKPPEPPPPPPPNPPTGADISTLPYGALWSSPFVCGLLEKELARDSMDGGRPGDKPASVYRAEAIDDLNTEGAYGFVKKWILKDDDDAARKTVAGEIVTFAVGNTMIKPLWDAISVRSVPDKEHSGILAAKIGMAREVERRTGIPMGYITTTEQYLLQYSAPQLLPTQAGLDTAYLHSIISHPQWECLTRSLGNVPECAQWVVDAQQVQPGVRDLVELYLRGHFPDEQIFLDRMRSMGVLNPARIIEFVKLAKFIPTVPDIVTFMTRDVFDMNVVNSFQLDTDFEAKFYGQGGPRNPGPAALWAQVSGVDAELFKYYWRAHWKLPSPTALYETLHRLRPDRPEVVSWNLANELAPNPSEFAAQFPKPPIATAADVRDALLTDDVAPGWVDRLMAVSYLPMNRTDAISAYMNGAMSAEELYQRFRDNGYDEPTARRMVEIQRISLARRINNLSGVWSVRKVCAAYLAGEITLDVADVRMAPLIPSQSQRTMILEGVDDERRALSWRAQIASWRRAILTGELTVKQVEDEMDNAGRDPFVTKELLSRWDAERKGRYKEAGARVILKALRQGILSTGESYRRLRNMGYSDADSNLMTLSGLIDAAKDFRAERKKWESELKAEIKDAKQAKRTAETDLTNRQKQLQAAMDRAQKEYDRIAKELGGRL